METWFGNLSSTWNSWNILSRTTTRVTTKRIPQHTYSYTYNAYIYENVVYVSACRCLSEIRKSFVSFWSKLFHDTLYVQVFFFCKSDFFVVTGTYLTSLCLNTIIIIYSKLVILSGHEGDADHNSGLCNHSDKMKNFLPCRRTMQEMDLPFVISFNPCRGIFDQFSITHWYIFSRFVNTYKIGIARETKDVKHGAEIEINT